MVAQDTQQRRAGPRRQRGRRDGSTPGSNIVFIFFVELIDGSLGKYEQGQMAEEGGECQSVQRQVERREVVDRCAGSL
eukprot:scaffold263190_cov31-Tisochrysis_lutea.AAC.2